VFKESIKIGNRKGGNLSHRMSQPVSPEFDNSERNFCFGSKQNKNFLTLKNIVYY
jgi:hypothetical protein